MCIKKGLFIQLSNFIGEDEADSEWFLRHTSVEFNDASKTIVITIDNIDDQEYEWLKEEI